MAIQQNKKFDAPKLVVDVVDSQGFTKQEVAMLRLLCMGITRKEMARQKSRSIGTVSKHVENIAGKLNAHSAAEIVAKAIAKGIVTISLQIISFLAIGFILASMINYSGKVAPLTAALPIFINANNGK